MYQAYPHGGAAPHGEKHDARPGREGPFGEETAAGERAALSDAGFAAAMRALAALPAGHPVFAALRGVLRGEGKRHHTERSGTS